MTLHRSLGWQRLALLVVGAVALLLAGHSSLYAQGNNTISGTAWFDRNPNGVRDPEEPRLSWARIVVTRGGQTVAETMTDDNGAFAFPNLGAGNYIVQGFQHDTSTNLRRIVLASQQQAVTVDGNRPATAELLLSLADVPRDQRYFPITGFRIDNDEIWNYFQARGGLDTFGYPISHAFIFRGFWVQLFQRHVIQVGGAGFTAPRPVNLLDPEFLPITRLNGSTFPGYDAGLASQAPGPNTPNYGDAVRRHLESQVPNVWNGQQVNFLNYYLSAAPPNSGGLRPLVALEIWGFPTSRPQRDPSNGNFIYQRFQRGIMHYDASTGITRAILLGEAFRNVITGQNLPPDLSADTETNPYRNLYALANVNALARQQANIGLTVSNTNLAYAFIGRGSIPPQGEASYKLFFVAVGDNGASGPLIGCGDSLVPVEVRFERTQTPLQRTLAALLNVRTQYYGESGFYNSLWQSTLRVDGATIDANGHATVQLSGQLLVGGVCDSPRIIAQLEATARQFSTVRSVSFLLNGVPLEQSLSER